MDAYLSQTLNSILGHSVTFDLFLDFIQDSYFVKGLFATVILVMLYTMRSGDVRARRTNILTTLVLVFIALFLGRIMQMVLPFTPRPLHAEGINLIHPLGVGEETLKHDSSFPSDHALMFMTIATSVLLYARLAGSILLFHALVVVSLPRVILGFHWTSDILMGLAIGAAIPLLLHRPIHRLLERSKLYDLQASHPAIFYGALFIVLTETATMYQGSRHMISELGDFVRYAF